MFSARCLFKDSSGNSGLWIQYSKLLSQTRHRLYFSNTISGRSLCQTLRVYRGHLVKDAR